MPTQASRSQTAHHTKTAAEVLALLAASPQGLSADEAQRRLAQYGHNRLPQTAKQGPVKRFFLQFHNILIYVLLAAAAVTASLGHWTDSAVILAVVIINASVGFLQEGKAEKAMEALHQMLAPKANVLRNKQRVSLDGAELVPGDIVLLEAGDRVPADCRLIQTHGLSVQEAVLTGESVPVDKQLDPVALDAPLGDRNNMVFSGTLVTVGQSQAVVVATGADTEIGHVNHMLAEVESLTTPLIRQMNIFSRWLTLLILLVAGILLVFGHFVSQMPFAELFMAVVGLSVAAIPEGLPAVLTITLAVGVRAMANRNAIVRRLPAIEAIGAVSVICTDKTGTLTRNEMMVASVAVPGETLTVTGVGYAPDGGIWRGEESVSADTDNTVASLAQICALCNDAALQEKDGVWQVEGDPMEGALLSLARKAGLDLRHMARDWPRTDTVPFDSRHRFMATLHHNHDGQGIALVKGAPEKILSLCRAEKAKTAEQPLSTDWHDSIQRIAAQGQRVLALAYREIPAGQTSLKHADLEGHLVLLGLVGMIDPPRQEAVDAVAECHRAGIRVKMITGDHAATAAAIGKQVGLQRADKVMTGADLDKLEDAQLRAQVLDCDIFARTSPEHKLRLVTALQSHGISVAMTGDGVNDAPALKRADAGIAMGKKGSEAAKEAAQLVLADDNFATIAAAVREGRTVYDNIKKVISWTLPTSAGEAMTIIAALLLGLSLPITPVQILWVNLITAVTLGLALAFEPTEANTMTRPPRRPGEPILNGELVWHIILVSLLFVAGVFSIHAYAANQGYSQALSQTLAMNTLVVMEIFHLFFIRNIYGTSLTWDAVRGTKIVWITVIVVTLAQFAVTYIAPLQAVFGTEAVSIKDGFIVVGIGVVLFALTETEKQLRLRLRTLNP